VNKTSDITFGSVTLPKSLDTAQGKLNESAIAEAAQGKLNSEVLLERNGSTPAFEDSSKSS
ncbi:YTH domain family protein, partial [Trifolium medium]|nr:YTH domain family protein [Trifolium medium]